MNSSLVSERAPIDLTVETSAPVLAIFPHNNLRNLVLSAYFNQTDSAYYAVTKDDTTWEVLTTHIIQAFAEQGISLKKMKGASNPYEAAYALAESITGVQTIILDQFELYSEAPADWLRGLAEGLPKKAKVVISTRALSHAAINPLIHSGHVAVIQEHSQSGQSALSGDTNQLSVFALGVGTVWFEGQVVTRWDGPLTRRLFYYLLDRGPVSRKQIFETFWPNLPVREATNVFHVTKRKMNETIGMDVTDYVDRHYRVADRVRLYYNVALFENALREADEGYGDESVSAWNRAIHIYRHQFLVTESMPWVIERRKQLREGYAQALISMARIYHKNGDAERALNYFMRAVIEAPMREDLHLQVMRLHADSGNTAAAVAQYELLEHRLKETLNIRPGKDAQQLYAKLRR